jgi:hypothetical protein
MSKRHETAVGAGPPYGWWPDQYKDVPLSKESAASLELGIRALKMELEGELGLTGITVEYQSVCATCGY